MKEPPSKKKVQEMVFDAVGEKAGPGPQGEGSARGTLEG